MQEHLEQEFDIVSGAAGLEALAQITEQINQQRSLPSILRQLCLLSVSQTAVKPKDWAAVTAALYHSYGHKHMQTLVDLEEAGLLLQHEGRVGNVPRLRKRFKLVVADGRVADGATLFGFKPLSAAVINEVTSKGEWDADLARSMPTGPVFTERHAGTAPPAPQAGGNRSNRGGLCLVYFLGGVTCAELAALRQLGKDRFVFATTNTCTAQSMLRSVIA